MRNVGALIVAAVLLPQLARAADAPTTPQFPGLVSTHATAHRRLPDTVADLSVSIESHGHSSTAVRKELDMKSQALLAFLRSGGAERLRTDTIAVEPTVETDRGHGLPDRIVGYTGTLTASFRAEIDKLPDLIDGSLTHGANEVGQVALTPREDEIDAAKQALAAEATTIAIHQLDAVAHAAGHAIAGVRLIQIDPPPPSEFADVSGGYPLMRERAAGAPAPEPKVAVAAGQSDVSVTVAITATLDR